MITATCVDLISAKGTRVFIAGGDQLLPSAQSIEAYDAMEWIEVGMVESVGEFGPQATIGTFTPISVGVACKFMGSIDNGEIQLAIANTETDSGLAALIARQGKAESIAMKIETPKSGEALPGHAVPPKRMRYCFPGLVKSAKATIGIGDDVLKLTTSLVINGMILYGPSSDSVSDDDAVISLFYDDAQGGLWLYSPEYLFEDSAASTPAEVSGPLGAVLDISTDSSRAVRRNLLTYSDDFRNTASAGETRPWSYTGISSLTLSGFDTPNGYPAYHLVPDGTSALHRIQQSATLSAGAATGSVLAKQGALRYLVLYGADAFTTAAIIVDLQSGAITNGGEGVVTDSGDGWWRISVNSTATSGAGRLVIGATNSPTSTSHTGDSVSGIHIAAGQLEPGPEPTIHQRIVTGAVTDWAPGNHALQQTSANKPTLRQTPETGIYWADSGTATSALVATFAEALGSECTVAYAGPEGVVIEENQTIGTTYNIAPPLGFNAAWLVIDRALTDSEKALLTRYLARFVPGLGDEILPNHDFSSGDSNWSHYVAAESTLSVSDGEATITRTSGASGALRLHTINDVGISAGEQILIVRDVDDAVPVRGHATLIGSPFVTLTINSSANKVTTAAPSAITSLVQYTRTLSVGQSSKMRMYSVRRIL